MKYSPRLILYLAAINYLNQEEINNLRKDLGSIKLRSDVKFMLVLKKHFNVELFKDKPRIWEDIWLYNYLSYELKTNRLYRSGLIVRYEKEIILPMEHSFKSLMKDLENIDFDM